MNKVLLTIAIIVPIVVGWLGVQIQFWFGAVIASPLGLVPAAILGLFASTRVSFEAPRKKYTFVVFHTIACIGILFLIGLFTSCANGDCI